MSKFWLLLCEIGYFIGLYPIDRLTKLEMDVWRAQRRALGERHRRKIVAARHFLTGANWRDPAGKEAFVDKVYGGKVPNDLWYALGDHSISDEEWTSLQTFFWKKKGPDFGECELHPSCSDDIGIILRIRHAKRFAPEIIVGRTACALCQTGQQGLSGSGPQPMVDFLEMYEEATCA